MLEAATEAFATTLRPSAREPGRVFAADFGSRKMSKELAVLDMAARSLAPAWENCVRAALSAKVAVEDEVAKSQSAQVRSVSPDVPIQCSVWVAHGSWQADNVKRTFDYEPFIREFITSLQNEGLLEDALKGPSPAGTGEPATPSKKSRTRKK